jgi:hypothetical protein
MRPNTSPVARQDGGTVEDLDQLGQQVGLEGG